MASPQFQGPDGVFRDLLILTTTIPSRFFQGSMDADTADMEISVRGGAFTSDPDLIVFEGASFTVPNPDVFPEGLDLASGLNTIRVRSISTSGGITAPGQADISLVQEGDLDFAPLPPTNLSIEKLDTVIQITAQAVTDVRLVGYNFYASEFEGGGASGYTLLNVSPVETLTPTQVVTPLGSWSVDSEVPTNLDGSPVADPLLFHVVGTQEDSLGTVLVTSFNELTEIPETVSKFRSDIRLSSVETVNFISFTHSRTATPDSDFPAIANGSFAALSVTEPLFYIATAVYFDVATNAEIESTFSVEVLGNPLTLSPVLGTFPEVRRKKILQDAIQSIVRSNRQLDVKPGAVIRDVVLDPFVEEASRIRFLVDFFHRAQTFGTLLQIDDPNDSGDSIPVNQSTYKQALKVALHLQTDVDVQEVIDQSFEKLASNFGESRGAGNKARGEVVFFTTRRPVRTINVPLGTQVSGGSAVFRTTAPAKIPFENVASFYNPSTGRYAVRVPVEADASGSVSNLGSNQIRTVVTGPGGFSVTNESVMFGGTDVDTNRQLAIRAQNAIASVDSGTRLGYLQTAAKVPGVLKVNVVASGEPLMQRDFDEAGVHRGGKVDIWVQGEAESNVTDNFAFSFERRLNVHFEFIGDLPFNLRFRAIHPDLSILNPILEMLDFASLGLGLRNASSGRQFDLDGVTLVSFDTILVSTVPDQPPFDLQDVILGDFRFRTGDKFIFSRQPVRDIVEVVGEISGTLRPAITSLVHPNSPLKEGRSTQAGDYLLVTDPGDGTGPSGEPIPLENEPHTIEGEYPESLNFLGANSLTLSVYNTDRTILYKGPNDPSGLPDYLIIEGDQTTPVAIQRVTTGNITSGQTLSLDYQHDENFSVEYTTNQIVQAVQDAVDANRHLTGDILSKDSVPVPVNISGTVFLQEGEDPATVDLFIRTRLGSVISSLRLGDPFRASDAAEVIKATEGVSHLPTPIPLTQMTRAPGAPVIREPVTTDQVGDSTFVGIWSSPTIGVWLLSDELGAATTDGGGDPGEFRGVFQNDVELELQIVDPSSLGSSPGKAYIIGNEGLVILFLSDDGTLRNQGFITSAEIEDQRRALTANRVMVSLITDDAPTNYSYAVTYTVGPESGVKDIDPSPAEYLTVGDLNFTYDEARNR